MSTADPETRLKHILRGSESTTRRQPQQQSRSRHKTYTSNIDSSFDVPAAPSGMPDISLGDASSFDHELNTSSFEDALVRQVQDIVSLRQQEIRKTEADLQLALKELQSVKQQEQSLLQRRVAHFKQEFKERVGELERQFLAQAGDLQREMLSKIEDQKLQCDSAIETKVQALAAAMKGSAVGPLGSPPRSRMHSGSPSRAPYRPLSRSPGGRSIVDEEAGWEDEVSHSSRPHGSSYSPASVRQARVSPSRHLAPAFRAPRRVAPHRAVKVLDLLDSDED